MTAVSRFELEWTLDSFAWTAKGDAAGSSRG